MRIIGGELSGRRFAGPKGSRTRPSAERLREALASALEARNVIEGAAVLDLFSGTGAISFELLSRGAERALAVERTSRVTKQLLLQAEMLGLRGRNARFSAVAMDLLRGPEDVAAQLARAGPFNLVFADPPYDHVAATLPLLAALVGRCTTTGTVLALEHSAREAPELPSRWTLDRSYRFGDSAFLLAQVE